MPMRVLAVADVYEALTSDRPYRRALRSDEALTVMRAEVPGRSTPTRRDARGRAGAGRRARPPLTYHRCGIPVARPVQPSLRVRGVPPDPSVDHRVVAAARLVAAAIHAG